MRFERFLLNDVLIDTQKMSVKVEGHWLPLEHKQLALIKLLIERAPNPVSRDDIINQLWPNLIVSDNSVSQLVAQIRKTLNDTSKEPKFIKTVPRVGYQCIADVANAPTIIQHAKTPQKNVPLNWLTAGLFIGVMSAFLVLFDFSASKPVTQVKYVSRLTSSPGAEVYLNFSPNGRFLAYSQIVTGESQYDLVVYDLQINTSHTIKSSGYSEQAPSWSMDGNWLIYYRYSPFSCEIRAISVHNTIELWRLNKDVFVLDCDSAQIPGNVTWNSTGQLFVREMNEGNKELVKYQIEETEDRQISLSERAVVTRAEDYHMRGNRVIYQQAQQWYQGILNGDGEVTTTAKIDIPGKPYFGLSDSDILSVGKELKLHSASSEVTSLYRPFGEVSEVSLDRGKGLIAHTEGIAEVNLYSYNLQGDSFEPISSNSRIDTHASISADGMQLAYVSTASHADPHIENVEIWSKHRFKSSPSLLTKLPIKDTPKLLVFSPNGEYLAVLSQSNTLFIISTFSKTPHSVVKENQSLKNIYWSDDSKTLFFETSESNHPQQWRHDIANASNALLPENAQQYVPLVKKNISFQSYIEDVKAYLFEALEGEIPLQQLSHSLQLYRPAVHENGIYYVIRQGHQLSLFNFNSQLQKNEFIADIGLHLYDVNADLGLSTTASGTQIILNRVENLEMDIVLHEFILE
ncbi:winged helix-turn-helix domain-containing protein [Pseudoalteromonas obscura]|uniref:Winged helix-turn-helix domain-containing protein n=1 Tax=Pseudoalteromonas obscura TaxID=3048491 RepID=A0ABT7EPB8_9GAMM|nr:winged helix-turn-helix domain-containing protein [Pseudoalteromonas sp. P94(2023)]MDK2596894.1 winged helix-turn-helix domain-containing protein [Pseudoalteromonas sp. P94(2023)]